MPHRLVLIVAGAAAAGAVVLAAHVSAAPEPGKTIVWSSPAGPPPSPGAASAGIPRAATPSATQDGGVLGGLRGPLSGIFGSLNSEAKHTASGQYSILQEISATLRGWIEHLLRGATSPH
jgi:hypothetical protein